MQDFGGGKIHVIREKGGDAILAELGARGIQAAHFTNGTYVAPKNTLLPTMLSGFRYVTDQDKDDQNAALIVAINSNASMEGIKTEKAKKGEDIGDVEDEIARAEKLLPALSLLFPDRDVVAIFYDEPTPTPLYNALNAGGLNMRSLYKWGYGTNLNAARIEGAHNFTKVYGFPFANNTLPLCHDLTVSEDQSAFVLVRDLTVEYGKHGAPYMTKEGTLLMPVPVDLAYLGVRADRFGERKPGL